MDKGRNSERGEMVIQYSVCVSLCSTVVILEEAETNDDVMSNGTVW